ncbi:ATP synthase subunit gamma [Candidatus Hepatincolaceae symbiont of Richtersius coronifer]
MSNLRHIKKRIANITIIEKIAQSMKVISSARLNNTKANRQANREYFSSSLSIFNALMLFHLERGNSNNDPVYDALFGKVNLRRQINQNKVHEEASKEVENNKSQKIEDPLNFNRLSLNKEKAQENNENLGVTKAKHQEKTLFIFIASDRGLAGSYNSLVMKHVGKNIKADSQDFLLLPIGLKSSNYAKKIFSEQSFEQLSEHLIDLDLSSDLKKIKMHDLLGMADHIYNLVKSQKVTAIKVIYTGSVSAVVQEVKEEDLLPFNLNFKLENANEGLSATDKNQGANGQLVEKNKNNPKVTGKEKDETDVLGNGDKQSGYFMNNKITDDKDFADSLAELFKQYITFNIYSKISEAMVAEHLSRLNAMENAHTNSTDLKHVLKLKYNRTRQDIITKELIEIIAGSEAL